MLYQAFSVSDEVIVKSQTSATNISAASKSRSSISFQAVEKSNVQPIEQLESLASSQKSMPNRPTTKVNSLENFSQFLHCQKI